MPSTTPRSPAETPSQAAGGDDPPARAPGPRARARAELTDRIKATARDHIARDGAAALSLRAVARDLGLVSSALYRYFPSRDDLLTALIVDAYDDLGRAIEAAEGAVPRHDWRGRWGAIAHALRRWARTHPHLYALLYGSPVPGYVAPPGTVPPAARPAAVLLGLVAEAAQADALAPVAPITTTRAMRSDLARLRQGWAIAAPDEVVHQWVVAWTGLYGALSFELFGHLRNTFDHGDDAWDLHVRVVADRLLR